MFAIYAGIIIAQASSLTQIHFYCLLKSENYEICKPNRYHKSNVLKASTQHIYSRQKIEHTYRNSNTVWIQQPTFFANLIVQKYLLFT